MYGRRATVPIKGSASLIQNNLTLINQDRSTIFGVVGKNSVYLTLFEDEKHVTLKQLIPKPNKDATEGQIIVSITEAKFLKLADKNVLVILTTKGIFFYEEDGVNLIYYHNLNVKPSAPEDTIYARGVVSMSPNMVAVGTSYGVILIFEVPMKGNSVQLKNEINDKHFQAGIAALASDDQGNFLSAADTLGNCVIFNVKTLNNIKAIQVFNQNKISVTALCMWRNHLITALASGVIRIFDLSEGICVVDLNAHARWIYSLDTKKDLLVSAGEDCCFRVWNLNYVNGKLKVSHLHSEKIVDTLITSAQFNHGISEICVSSYDNMEVLVYGAQ